MQTRSETAFTQRMRRLCDEAKERCPGYDPRRFRNMVEGCNGDFLPKAKSMLLSGLIQRGLWTLAKHGAIDISMEFVVQQEPWCRDFTGEHLKAASWRIAEAQRRADAGEPPDNADW